MADDRCISSPRDGKNKQGSYIIGFLKETKSIICLLTILSFL